MFGAIRLYVWLALFLVILVVSLPVSQTATAANDRDFDPAGRFTFIVDIDGVTSGPFMLVSGIESETEVIEYRSGNDRAVRKKPGLVKYSNIILKRGYTGNSELWNWYRTVINGQVERRSGSIVLMRADRTEIDRYNFFEAFPVRYKTFELDGTDGISPMMEEIEITVEFFEKG
jgi:phage tail-like protein